MYNSFVILPDILYINACKNPPTDGSLSDTATDRKKGGTVDQERSPKGGSGMGKKSNSTSQLSATGRAFLFRSLFALVYRSRSVALG